MRDPPGDGNCGFTMQPGGATIEIGRQAPSLFGKVGLVQTFTPYITMA
jgi:hypothetical protein